MVVVAGDAERLVVSQSPSSGYRVVTAFSLLLLLATTAYLFGRFTRGAALTTWVTFALPMMLIFAGAPFIEQLRANQRLSGALAAVTAAVVGVILNLTVWFALHVLFARVTEVRAGPVRWYAFDVATLDWKAAVLAGLAAVLMLRLHRGLVEAVAVMAALGVLLRFLA